MKKVRVSLCYDPETDRLEADTEGSALDTTFAAATFLLMVTEKNAHEGMVRAAREMLCEFILNAPVKGCVKEYSRMSMKDFRRAAGKDERS